MTTPEPQWSMLETMAWIIYRSERAVDLVSAAATRRGSGEADSPTLLDAALPECTPVPGWDEDAPQYLYPTATHRIVDACRRGALQAGARPGWARDWQPVPERAWKDGQWWWADQYGIGQHRVLDAPALQESTLRFFLAFDGMELTDLDFPASQVMAAWPPAGSKQATKGRGRPEGTGKDDSEALRKIREMRADGATSDNAAITAYFNEIGLKDADQERTERRRLQRKLSDGADR